MCLFMNLFLCVPVFAQECDSSCANTLECQRKIAKCQEAWSVMESAKKPHVEALRKMEADITAFQNRIQDIEAELVKKAEAIVKGEKELTGLLEVASRRIRQFYMRTAQSASPVFSLLSSTNVGTALRVYGYQQAVTNEDKKVISGTAVLVKNLEDKKKTLESEKAVLGAMKEDVDSRAASVRKLVGDANAYQSKLSGFIASLTSQQTAFLGAKLSSLNLPTSLGAGALYCTDDRKLDPGFSPAFAFFTFGIPHRVGMNQYGALGRAQAGQGYQDILRAYFDGVGFEQKDNITIRVSGYGSMPLEQYMLGVYEIPDSWPMEALKAQAVAARSYALAYTQNGANEICTSQSCQVYKGGNKGGNWETAVKATERQVMVRDGSVITAWYSSTDGGYTYTSSDVGWSARSWTKRLRDTNGDIGSFSDLFVKAYDRDSPCFYAAQGYRSQYGKSAWLKSEEVADIANVILLARADSSLRSHLYQPDKSNPEGTDSWSADRVKQELASRGITAFTSVSGVTATGVDFSVGRTTQVTLMGNKTESFDGDEFRNYFNIRAPANIQIVGPLFNIERK
jgi:SpoIID/LytB domain protein